MDYGNANYWTGKRILERNGKSRLWNGKKLTRFPCIIAGKNGVQSVDQATFKKMFESGDGDKIQVLNISDVESQLITENTAIIGYSITLAIADDQQKTPVKCACTSTWIKEQDNWVCALHTETELSQQ